MAGFRLFSAGCTPLNWLNRHRLRRAQHLLEATDQPVEQIGAAVGFPAPTTFRERFRKLVGVSPQAYRRYFRGDGDQQRGQHGDEPGGPRG